MRRYVERAETPAADERVACSAVVDIYCRSMHGSGQSWGWMGEEPYRRPIWWMHAEDWEQVFTAMKDDRFPLFTHDGNPIATLTLATTDEDRFGPVVNRHTCNVTYVDRAGAHRPLYMSNVKNILIAEPTTWAREEEINEAVASILHHHA